jgi:hypothetical protein
MALNLNQFKLSSNIGEVMNPAANTIQAQVLSSLAAASYYYAGDVVAFGTGSGDMPMVRKVSTGCGVGVILFNAKKAKYSANDIVSVALDGTIVTMQASSLIMRGDIVGWGSTGVSTVASGNGIGIALDIAATATDIIRVEIKAGIATGITWY